MAKKKYKKIWNSKEEWEASKAQTERDIRRLHTLAERAWADLVKKKPELRDL